MPKKNQEIYEIIEAIARIYKLIAQDPGDNIWYSKALARSEHELIGKMIKRHNQSTETIKKVVQGRSEIT